MREALGLLPEVPQALLSDCLQLPTAFPDAGQRVRGELLNSYTFPVK
jgi:hypothetical protein